MDTFVERDFPRLKSLICDAAVEETKWWQVLRAIGDVLADAKTFSFDFNIESQQSTNLRFNGVDPSSLKAYERYYAALNPYPATVFFNSKAPPATVLNAHDFVAPAQAMQTEFYNDFMKPQQMGPWHFGAILHRDASDIGLFTVLPQGNYAHGNYEDLRKKFSMLAPHLVRAVEINRVLSRHMQIEHALGSSLDALAAAAFVLEASGKLLHANGLGETMLRAGDVLARQPDGSLAAKHAAEESALEAAVRNAGAPGAAIDPPVRLTSRARPAMYLAWIMRMRDTPTTPGGPLHGLDGFDRHGATLVLVSRTDRKIEISADVLRAAYDLSPAEARLVAALAGGESIADYASRLGLSRNTVRNQMASIFDKTDTRRQAELVARVLAAIGPFAGLGRQ